MIGFSVLFGWISCFVMVTFYNVSNQCSAFTLVYVNVYVNVYIHYFIFKSLSYQYVAHFKMFYKSYKTHKKYKRLHKCKRRALIYVLVSKTLIGNLHGVDDSNTNIFDLCFLLRPYFFAHK
jgi:hypothetical protein